MTDVKLNWMVSTPVPHTSTLASTGSHLCTPMPQQAALRLKAALRTLFMMFINLERPFGVISSR
jgi:hypothetical protein